MAPSPTLRRLLQEAKELSAAAPKPNPAFHAAPTSDSNLHEWHFTLLGPPAPSPYAGGVYHGRISLPPQYPLKPPNFRFLTPSGRFEVNREICLSISGFHEETWMPAWGVRTALTALRSFMGEEGTAGQVGGLEAPKQVRERLARESRSWTCTECGLSGLEVMQNWWEVCRVKGITVDEEGMGSLQLESLPDGMNVQPFERKPAAGEKGKVVETSTIERPSDQSAHVESGQAVADRILPSGDNKKEIGAAVSNGVPTQDLLTNALLASKTTSQNVTSTSPSQSVQSLLPAQTGQAPDPRTQTAARQQQDHAQAPAITLDRAITAIFLALVLMILKKIFLLSFSGSRGVPLEEWDEYAGLTREY